jgi:hypothetical protein
MNPTALAGARCCLGSHEVVSPLPGEASRLSARMVGSAVTKEAS